MEDAGQVHGEYLVPLFRGDVEKSVSKADTGIVDSHIQAAKFVHNCHKGLPHLRVIGDIGEECCCDCRKVLLDRRASALVAIEDRDIRSFLQKARGGGCADATGASGNDNPLACESSHGSASAARSSQAPDHNRFRGKAKGENLTADVLMLLWEWRAAALLVRYGLAGPEQAGTRRRRRGCILLLSRAGRRCGTGTCLRSFGPRTHACRLGRPRNCLCCRWTNRCHRWSYR